MDYDPNLNVTEAFSDLHVPFDPIPFSIDVSGQVNGTTVRLNGAGFIPKLGVYRCTLNFDTLPPDFHPSAIATYVVSICCVAAGSERNGGLNFRNMGAAGYRTKRVLTFPDGQIIIDGDVSLGRSAAFKGTINGDARIKAPLAGNSVYIKRLDPVSDHVVSGVGEGSIHTLSGSEIPVIIETLHTLRPEKLANPLRKTQFRVVTECGDLVGRTYSTQVHSVLDGKNTMGNLLNRRCSLI